MSGLKMMGRDKNGLARPVVVDSKGAIQSSMTGSLLQRRTGVRDIRTRIPIGESFVLLDNHKFDGNVTSWGLFFFIRQRPVSHLQNGKMQLLIEYSNFIDSYDETDGRLVYKKYVDFSGIVETGKGFLEPISSESSGGVSAVVMGERFNVPMANYMRLTLINNTDTISFDISAMVMVEEGNF